MLAGIAYLHFVDACTVPLMWRKMLVYYAPSLPSRSFLHSSISHKHKPTLPTPLSSVLPHTYIYHLNITPPAQSVFFQCTLIPVPLSFQYPSHARISLILVLNIPFLLLLPSFPAPIIEHIILPRTHSHLSPLPLSASQNLVISFQTWGSPLK